MLERIAAKIRKSSFEMIKNAESGHLGACSSSAELVTALYFHTLNYDIENSKHPVRDRVLVRGHLGPLRYSLFSLLGWIDESELCGYRSLGSRLQGHESMDIPGVDLTPSGSLGMLLSYGAGIALSAKKLKKNFLTYVFLGDGEEQEGNVSEAARHIGNLGLDNIICIIDKNGKQLSGPTIEHDGSSNLNEIWKGYGWDVREISNANSFEEIVPVYDDLVNRKGPVVVVVNTTKGKYLKGAECNHCGYHTISSCPSEVVDEGILEQKKIVEMNNFCLEKEVEGFIVHKSLDDSKSGQSRPIETKVKIDANIDKGNLVDTLIDYVNKLHSIMEEQDARLYILTADLIGKDQVRELGIKDPTTYVDVGIREQHMIGLAHGISQTDPNARILINAGDAFLYRSLDQLNACAQSRSPMVIVGDDGGLSGAKNGSTHQSSGQPGALLTMPGIRVLEPADSGDLINCLNLAFTEYDVPTYIRLHTLPTANFRNINRGFDYYLVFDSDCSHEITIVGSGMTTKACVEAARILEEKGIGSRVINVVNKKGLDDGFNQLVVGDKPCLCVYNGNSFILTSAVADSILKSRRRNVPSILKGHGFEMGRSGSLEDLVRHFGFDGPGIAKTINAGLL
ncbi:MAG: hypothetical protein HC877_23025 [Thioploca sp.]|nr:hypothetical protein [Thioploca sp.]